MVISSLMRYSVTVQTKLYTEDWIGLRTLDEAGKVKYINVSGNHLGISDGDMVKHVVPYLINPTDKEDRVDSSATLNQEFHR